MGKPVVPANSPNVRAVPQKKMPVADMPPVFFETPAQFGAWLAQHAASSTELMVGFMKRGTGMPSITWPEAVDESLCVGWIDAVRYRIDDQRYKIRFTVRKANSIWSAVNIERMAVLTAQGRVQPAGLAAFARRSEAKSRIYAHEQAVEAALPEAQQRLFDQHSEARTFFDMQPAGYRKQMLWWVVSAKQEATRDKRLRALIAACESGQRL